MIRTTAKLEGVVERPGPEARPASPAFEAFYRREWRPLVALGWSLTGSWAAAEELVQEAMTDAYRRWDEIGGLDKPGAWARRAVINRAASQARRRSVERRGLTRLAARSTAEADAPGADRTGDAATEAVVTEAVADPAFWDALHALPERQRACLALRYLEDQDVAAIADTLGCSPATVRVHLHRGRRTLAKRLDRATSRTTDHGPQEVDR